MGLARLGRGPHGCRDGGQPAGPGPGPGPGPGARGQGQGRGRGPGPGRCSALPGRAAGEGGAQGGGSGRRALRAAARNQRARRTWHDGLASSRVRAPTSSSAAEWQVSQHPSCRRRQRQVQGVGVDSVHRAAQRARRARGAAVGARRRLPSVVVATGGGPLRGSPPPSRARRFPHTGRAAARVRMASRGAPSRRRGSVACGVGRGPRTATCAARRAARRRAEAQTVAAARQAALYEQPDASRPVPPGPLATRAACARWRPEGGIERLAGEAVLAGA